MAGLVVSRRLEHVRFHSWLISRDQGVGHHRHRYIDGETSPFGTNITMAVCSVKRSSSVLLRNELVLYQFRAEGKESRLTDLFDGVALESMKAAD